MTAPSALNLDGAKFCESIADLCTRYQISTRRLSSICDGCMNRFSKSSAQRLLKGTIRPEHLEEVQPVLLRGLRRFLAEDRQLHAAEIEEILSPIFDQQEFTLMLHERCELDLRVQRYFGFHFDPFDVDRIPSIDEVFTTPELDAVAERVKDAILYQRFVAVVGDVGSGKTLLKHRVTAELALNESIDTRLLFPEFPELEQLEVHQIASYILTELGQTVPRSKPDRVKLIKQVLEEMYYEDVRVSLVIDEGHHLNDRVLTSLKNFWELTKGISSVAGRNRSMTNRLLGIVIYAQPQFTQGRLRQAAFREIRQRVQVIEMPKLVVRQKNDRYDWTAAADYVRHRIRLAGGDAGKVFDPDALDIICRNATTPLTIGNLVNEALAEAYEREEKRVGPGFRIFKNLRDTPVIATRRPE